jgi:hypothetical protein
MNSFTGEEQARIEQGPQEFLCDLRTLVIFVLSRRRVRSSARASVGAWRSSGRGVRRGVAFVAARRASTCAVGRVVLRHAAFGAGFNVPFSTLTHRIVALARITRTQIIITIVTIEFR